jgi:hypothetical protein
MNKKPIFKYVVKVIREDYKTLRYHTNSFICALDYKSSKKQIDPNAKITILDLETGETH